MGGAFIEGWRHFQPLSLPSTSTQAMPGMAEKSLADFLDACGYSASFGPDLLYPMLSVVCTCSYEAVLAYPAALIVDYFADK